MVRVNPEKVKLPIEPDGCAIPTWVISLSGFWRPSRFRDLPRAFPLPPLCGIRRYSTPTRLANSGFLFYFIILF